MFFLCTVLIQGATNTPAVITNLGGLKALSISEAAEARRVKVRATLLTTNGSWFLQDNTGAVYVYGAKDKAVPFKRGDLVDVEGFSLAGGFSPILSGDTKDVADLEMKFVSHGQLPTPRRPTVEELLWGKDDCAWVEVEGVVRRILPSQADSGRFREFPLDVGGVSVLVDIDDEGAPEKIEALVDARIRVRGVMATTVNVTRQLVRTLVHVNSIADLEVLSPPRAAAFDLPLSNPMDIFGFRNERPGHQLRIRGTVVWHDPEVGLRLRVGEDNVFARLTMTNRLAPGTIVEVAGFAVRGELSPRLDDCLVKVIGKGPEQMPYVYKKDEFPKSEFQSTLWSSDEGELVEVHVHLEESVRTEKGISMIVSHGDQTLMAELSLNRDQSPPRIRRGSELRLTGVFALDSGDGRGASSSKLLLRSPADVVVVSHPSWMTPEKITGVLFGSIAAGLLVSYWLAALRRKNQLLRRALAENDLAKIELQEAHDLLEDRVRERTVELDRACVAAEAASRSKGMFVANMSHEIRTPMNGVIGFTQLLLESGLNVDQQEMAERIRQSSESMMTLINDILDFSKIEAGKMTCERVVFDLLEVLENAVESVAERSHRKGLELCFFVSPELPRIFMGDAGRIRQIVLNLLSNAIKFTEAGEVTLEVTKIGGGAHESDIRFEVRDTGIGITEEAQNRLFQAFEQADGSTTRKYGGTGLGLAISRRLTELMGGRMGVESSDGAGSTFWFELSLTSADMSGEPWFVLDPRLKDVSILIADDNNTVRRHLSRLVTAWGMRPTEASNDVEALAALKCSAEKGSPIAIALLERAIRNTGGLDMALCIKETAISPETQVILLASLFELLNREAMEEAGMTFQVTKPICPSKLYQVFIEAVGGTLTRTVKAAVLVSGTESVLNQERLRVLLAEDNVVNQALARQQLKKLGHAVQVAGNGLQVLEALGRDHFDVILMDCQMPELDGYETTARIRNGLDAIRNIPIIAMTANAMQGDREKCLAAGMSDYVTKPVRIDDLKQALERAIAAQS